MGSADQRTSEEETAADSDQSFDDRYRSTVKQFRNLIPRFFELSQKSHGVRADERTFWASILFLRLCLMCGSISRLCPDIDVPEQNVWWDFTSIASLVRTLFENLAFFFYFSEHCDRQEWNAKRDLMHLNDRQERITMFTKMKLIGDVTRFQQEAEEIKQRLTQNSHFQSLDANLRKVLLNGHRPAILNLSDMVARFAPEDDVWAIYQFLSSYTHGLPLSFLRTYEQGRNGLPNSTEMIYICTALAWLTPFLERAASEYEALFQTL